MKIVDAGRPLSFVITAAHIRRAKRRNPCECVVAQALKDKLGPLVKISVGAATTKVYTGKKVVRYRTPDALRNALQRFDIHGKWDLDPGAYRLAVKPPSQRVGEDTRRMKARYKLLGNEKLHVAKLPRTRVVEYPR